MSLEISVLEGFIGGAASRALAQLHDKLMLGDALCDVVLSAAKLGVVKKSVVCVGVGVAIRVVSGEQSAAGPHAARYYAVDDI